jgi:c-di-GMP-binding flagellar brake protein YcgR
MADISLGGLAFTIDRMPEDELLADTHRTIEFHVPNRERRIRLLAKIVYANRISSSASLRIGVAFVKVSEMDLASIARYMALSDENFHCAGAGR